MANKKTKPTKETVKAEKSDEVLTEVSLKDSKKSAKDKKENKVDQKKLKNKSKKKNDKPKRNRGKEIISELKKVNWPSFAKACKQTGTVLAVVSVFMLAVLGIDSLVAWILSLITKI